MQCSLRSELGALFWSLLRKEIRSRYLSSNLGALWLFLQPLIMLLIYQFVFERIFRIRFPGMEEHGFLLFVAVALWPWFAFSEALMGATRALEKHADILKKVDVNEYVLVLVEVAAPFCIHALGFVLIILAFMAFGHNIGLFALLFSLLLWLMLLLLTYGLSLACSALQVFLRDVAQVVQTGLMLWFYLTPIVYPLSLIPESLRDWVWFNPLAGYMTLFRMVLLEDPLASALPWAAAMLTTCAALLLGLGLFARLRPAFEDML